MGEVAVGDQLLGADGRPTTVTAAFEVMYDRPCYEVEFSDGSRIVADAEHLWRTTTRASLEVTAAGAGARSTITAVRPDVGVVTTAQIAATLWTDIEPATGTGIEPATARSSAG